MTPRCFPIYCYAVFCYSAMLVTAVNSFSILCCKCRAQYSCKNLQITFWNPLNIAASMSIPTFFRLISWGLAEISSTQNLLKVSSSLVNYTITGTSCTGFFLFLIAIRRVSYPHIAQLKGGIFVIGIATKQLNILQVLFCVEKSYIWISRNYHSANRTGRAFLCTNQSFKVTLRWRKWFWCKFSFISLSCN